MKTARRQRINLMTSLVFLTFTTLMAGLFSTLAWFTANQRVDNGMGNITAVSKAVTGTEMKAYSVSAIESNVYTFVNNESYTLPRFDPSNIDYTEYEKALVLRVVFNTSVAKTYYLNAYTEKGFNSDLVSERNDSWLSNCIEFRAGSSTEDIDPDTFESSTVTAEDMKSFVSLKDTYEDGEDPVAKTQYISLIEINAHLGVNIVYIVMEYNNDIIEYINGIRMANPNPITYGNDVNFKIEEELPHA